MNRSSSIYDPSPLDEALLVGLAMITASFTFVAVFLVPTVVTFVMAASWFEPSETGGLVALSFLFCCAVAGISLLAGVLSFRKVFDFILSVAD